MKQSENDERKEQLTRSATHRARRIHARRRQGAEFASLTAATAARTITATSIAAAAAIRVLAAKLRGCVFKVNGRLKVLDNLIARWHHLGLLLHTIGAAQRRSRRFQHLGNEALVRTRQSMT